jgi:hypothetical protein
MCMPPTFGRPVCMLVFGNVMQYQEMCWWAEMQMAGLMLWWKQLFLISLCDAGQVLTCELIQYDSSQFCRNSFIAHHLSQTHGPLCSSQSRFSLLPNPFAFSVVVEVIVRDFVSDMHKVITALIPLMSVSFASTTRQSPSKYYFGFFCNLSYVCWTIALRSHLPMATKLFDGCGYTTEVSGSTLKFLVAMCSIWNHQEFGDHQSSASTYLC